MAARKRPRAVEWVGGCFDVHTYVLKSQPYRPVKAVWMEEDVVLAKAIAHPLQAEQALERALRRACATPLVGSPRRPDRVRVEDKTVVPIVRRVLGANVTVCVAETPELWALVDTMGALADTRGVDVRGYLSDEAFAPEDVADFFRATTTLYRANPWSIVADDSVVWAVDAPALGARGAAAIVTGQLTPNPGLILFDSFDAMLAFRGSPLQAGDEPPQAALLAVEFDADVSDGLRHEVEAHAWEIPRPDLFPVVRRLDADLILAPIPPRALARLGATARALARMVTDVPQRLGAPTGPTVTTEVDGLILTLPHPRALSSGFEAEMAPLRELRILVRAFLASELRGRVPGVWRDLADAFVDALLRRRRVKTQRVSFDHWPKHLVDEALEDVREMLEDDKDLERLLDVSRRFFTWMTNTGRMSAALALELHRVVERGILARRTATHDPKHDGAASDLHEFVKDIRAWSEGIVRGRGPVFDALSWQVGFDGTTAGEPVEKRPTPRRKRG
jgi:hypothetical protein